MQADQINTLNLNLDKKRDQIDQYKSKYNDIDIDALHERNQYLQTRLLSYQMKVGVLRIQVKEFQESGKIADKS